MNTISERPQYSREELLELANGTIVPLGMDQEELMEALERVEQVVTDLDGTLLPAGSTDVPAEMLEALRHLHAANIPVYCLTGKPWSEVQQLCDALPADIPVTFLLEKGAFMYKHGDEELQLPTAFLSNDDDKEVAQKFRENIFFESVASHALDRGISLRRAGDGGHKVVVSIDIFEAGTDEKISRGERLSTVIDILQSNLPTGWVLNNLGNGNIEMHPAGIEKGNAVRAILDTQPQPMLRIGDSGNDVSLLQTKREEDVAGAVVCEHTPDALLDAADMGVVGEAQGNRVLELLARLHTPKNVVMLSNTAPADRLPDGTVKQHVGGANIALTRLFDQREHRQSTWIVPSADGDTFGLPYLQSVVVDSKAREQHKAVSSAIWAAMHPHAFPEPITIHEDDLRGYESVNAALAEQAGTSDIHTMEWVHDFQLLSVGRMLKQNNPTCSPQLFWHIPFPTLEELRERLPDAHIRTILTWMNAYATIGFHTNAYARNYEAVSGAFDIRPARTFTQSIGIDTKHVANVSQATGMPAFSFDRDDLNATLADVRLKKRLYMAPLERANDPIKAADIRLEAIRSIAQHHRAVLDDVLIGEMATQSRKGEPRFDELHQRRIALVDEINQLVGREVIRLIPAVPYEDGIALQALSRGTAFTSHDEGFGMAAMESVVASLALPEEQRAQKRFVVSPRLGYAMSLEDAGFHGALPVFPEKITAQTIRPQLEQLFTGELAAPDWQKLAKHAKQTTLHNWSRRNIQECVRSTALPLMER